MAIKPKLQSDIWWKMKTQVQWTGERSVSQLQNLFAFRILKLYKLYEILIELLVLFILLFLHILIVLLLLLFLLVSSI